MFVIVKIYDSMKPRMEILCCDESIKTLLTSEYVFVEFGRGKLNVTIFQEIDSAEIALKEIEIEESVMYHPNRFQIVPLNELETFVKNHFEQ